jgi:hypothetical protein
LDNLFAHPKTNSSSPSVVAHAYEKKRTVKKREDIKEREEEVCRKIQYQKKNAPPSWCAQPL